MLWFYRLFGRAGCFGVVGYVGLVILIGGIVGYAYMGLLWACGLVGLC
jgi:hypothetical protein